MSFSSIHLPWCGENIRVPQKKRQRVPGCTGQYVTVYCQQICQRPRKETKTNNHNHGPKADQREARNHAMGMEYTLIRQHTIDWDEQIRSYPYLFIYLFVTPTNQSFKVYQRPSLVLAVGWRLLKVLWR